MAMDADSRNFALTQAERMTLMGFTTHPGWPVLNATDGEGLPRVRHCNYPRG